MDNNSGFSIQDAMRLAQTPAGQQLFALLQQQNSAQLQNAMSSAASGDYDKAKNALASLLDSPEAKDLLEKLRR